MSTTATVHQLGESVFAYVPHSRGMGFANAGLIASRGEALLVDTLWDVRHTAAMLEAFRARAPARIERAVITHGNGDHCWGNQLLGGVEIIASRLCVEDMQRYPPATMRQLKAAVPNRPYLALLQEQLAPFDFDDVELTLPTRTFEDQLSLEVGDLRVELLRLGPAHTPGDTIVFVPDTGTVFAGDLVFRECTPFGWEGSYERWLWALDQIAELDVDQIVPGHGPVCDKRGLAEIGAYFRYVYAESRRAFEAGRTLQEAAESIELGEYGAWAEPERVVYNIARAYREFACASAPDFFEAADIAAGLARKFATARTADK
jgi:cyclase